MKRERDSHTVDLTGRIQSLEQFTGSLVARPQVGGGDRDAIPINAAPVSLVPRPRRSRVFLRGGEGHGVFADLTLTAPVPD
ncbi:hypothetical protein F4692_001691 [Nocardioides cavernae]|uniref:Uncharacterized protein n=1 Tax=Nocardioides cavernae TaxID=1921566 RepID=A0A7Y9H2P1_9ACTN|nr:hypothetical protein [Nocardioides cavernae]NYE36558.1 hypothetical protein [Nocardioides cavernae]